MYRPLKINSIHRSISGSYLNQWLRDVKHCHFSVNVGNRYNNRALYAFLVIVFVFMFFFFNDTATTEIYTRSLVGSVRCV